MGKYSQHVAIILFEHKRKKSGVSNDLGRLVAKACALSFSSALQMAGGRKTAGGVRSVPVAPLRAFWAVFFSDDSTRDIADIPISHLNPLKRSL